MVMLYEIKHDLKDPSPTVAKVARNSPMPTVSIARFDVSTEVSRNNSVTREFRRMALYTVQDEAFKN